MIAEGFNTQPAKSLLMKHRDHADQYIQYFHGLELIIAPEVFNPAYTKVSGFLADNLIVDPGSKVLEMFSGSGALSFLAAQTAQSVVGVDISPKAIECAQANAQRLGLADKIEFRTANLWEGVEKAEKFNTIIANPPLLPAIPENLLEMAIADSPMMRTTMQFLQGCSAHLTESGRVFMAFSDACKIHVGNPIEFIQRIASASALTMNTHAYWDVGYEVYRILELRKENIWQK